MTLLVYGVNELSPPPVKLGLFYLLPVLVVTWYEGPVLGAVFTLGAMGLRLATELEQQAPQTTLSFGLLNQLSFAMVAGVAIFAFAHVRRTQLQLRELATHDALTHVLNAKSFRRAPGPGVGAQSALRPSHGGAVSGPRQFQVRQ